MLKVECEHLGGRVRTLVKMVKTGTARRYEEPTTIGSLPNCDYELFVDVVRNTWADIKASFGALIRMGKLSADYGCSAASARPEFDQTQPVGWGRPPNFVIIFIGPRGNRS